MKRVGSVCSISEADDFDLSKLLDKPRLNIERKRSFDERSLSELTIGFSPRVGSRAPESSSRGGLENFESMFSLGGRSGMGTPASSARNSFEPHPMIAEAWEALRRSLVFFRGQPVGTIAAYDHASEEVLNYDQVYAMNASFPAFFSFLSINFNRLNVLEVLQCFVEWLICSCCSNFSKLNWAGREGWKEIK